MRTLIAGAALLIAASVATNAQRPDTVFFEDLTFDEIRDAIGGGSKNVIIAVGGAEDGGAQIVVGRPSDVITDTADRIARAVGDTLVAPVIPYAPGGLLPLREESSFTELLESAANSAKGSGFENIFFIGESAGSQQALAAVAERLDAAWKGDGVRVVHVSDYFVKARTAQEMYLAKRLGLRLSADQARTFTATSEILAINAQRTRLETLDNSGGAIPAPQHGIALLKIKVDHAVAQIQTSLGRSRALAAPASAPVELRLPL